MSTTDIYSGIDDNSKSSSRVLQPPGGGSSNIFGAATDDAKPKKIITGTGDENRQTAGAQLKERDGDTKKCENDGKALANKSKNMGAYNPITGAVYTEENQPQLSHHIGVTHKAESPLAEVKEHPPSSYKPGTRVRQPPGGASSGSLW